VTSVTGLPILPIDTGRYGSAEIRRVFDEETRFQKMLDVEAALAWARAQVGDIPSEAADDIERHASTGIVTVDRIHDIEKIVDHEVMALVEALAEASGRGRAYVHLGATSSDILDTALALQMKEGLDILSGKLDAFEQVLVKLAQRYHDLLTIGRTHGQHALPTTLGMKFAVWLREIARHGERIAQCRQRVLVGKMSGAVGTMAGFGANALQIQQLVMKRLGLGSTEVTSQIVQRDRYAELICDFAMIASSLDKFATEIRNLQRPEIAEVAERFGVGRQVGSSTMPQKKNPWRCETISSLAKIERSLASPALEAIVTWHERDLTQSASERFIIPEAFILLDHMLNSMTKILSNLQVDEARITENLMRFKDPTMTESVMIALVRKGLARQDAHRLLQEIVFGNQQNHVRLEEALLANPTVSKYLTKAEIDVALDPRSYVGMSHQLVDAAVVKTLAERRMRGLSN